MRSLGRLLAENGPGKKPELWSDLPAVVRRRLLAWLNSAIDPSWAGRPFITTIKPEHLLLEVTPSDVVGKPIVHFGVYEYAVSTIVREYLKRGDTFVDVGANIGYYSIIGAHLVGRTGQVFAFEPSPRIRARLLRNIALNDLSQILVRSEAVSSSSGIVRLVEPEGKNNDGLAFVDRSGAGDGVDVTAVRLDEVFEVGRPAPALIKIDVEGGEPDVFAGAHGLFAREDAPSILFESFEVGRDAKLLRERGYQIFQPALRDGALRLTADLDAPRYRHWEAPNYLAVKSERGREFAGRLS